MTMLGFHVIPVHEVEKFASFNVLIFLKGMQFHITH